MNHQNNTTAHENDKIDNIIAETDIIKWKPSQARANWRVRQLSVSPRLRHELRDLANLYDKLANQMLPCCFVYCHQVLQLLYHASQTNSRIRQLFRSGRIVPLIKQINIMVIGGAID